MELVREHCSTSENRGDCEAFVGYAAARGHFDEVDLSGVAFTWALRWPGAINNKGGRGHAYVDCRTDEQFEAIRIVKPDGFIWKDVRIGQGAEMGVDLPEMKPRILREGVEDGQSGRIRGASVPDRDPLDRTSNVSRHPFRRTPTSVRSDRC